MRIIFILLIINLRLNSQVYVINAKRAPVSGVNILIIENSIPISQTDKLGRFYINQFDIEENSELSFNHTMYNELRIKASELKNKDTLMLNSKNILLDEVNIKAKKGKYEIIDICFRSILQKNNEIHSITEGSTLFVSKKGKEYKVKNYNDSVFLNTKLVNKEKKEQKNFTVSKMKASLNYPERYQLPINYIEKHDLSYSIEPDSSVSIYDKENKRIIATVKISNNLIEYNLNDIYSLKDKKIPIFKTICRVKKNEIKMLFLYSSNSSILDLSYRDLQYLENDKEFIYINKFKNETEYIHYKEYGEAFVNSVKQLDDINFTSKWNSVKGKLNNKINQIYNKCELNLIDSSNEKFREKIRLWKDL